MKVIELLKISSEALKLMSENGIYLEDYKYVDAYEQFLRMRMFGIKYRAAIGMLAEERGIGERSCMFRGQDVQQGNTCHVGLIHVAYANQIFRY